MRKDRLYEEKVQVNKEIGGENLSSQERHILNREAGELATKIGQAKKQPISE
jgi:hypothetical protein